MQPAWNSISLSLTELYKSVADIMVLGVGAHPSLGVWNNLFWDVDWAALGDNPHLEVTWTYDHEYNPDPAFHGTSYTSGGGTAITGQTLTFPVTAFAGLPVGWDPAWDGTITAPYEVSTAEQLQFLTCLGNAQTNHVELKSDIDLSGMNFFPIGHSNLEFEGVFNGNGHTISNLTIRAPFSVNVALFGFTRALIVNDLNLESPQIYGYEYTAALLGRAARSTLIKNVHVTDAQVTGIRNSATFIAFGDGILVTDSSVTGEIVATRFPHHGSTPPTP